MSRDYIFLSYAWEDSALLEWLALKLTAAGYGVWADRFELLGGEPYPRDIDRAIKERTFRLVALISRASVQKPNPRKERTLALNLGRERGEDFLIPLNVDGLKPTELDWMLSDLTYIPFDRSWAEGLAQLLKKLEAVGAPRHPGLGLGPVAEWYARRENVLNCPETLWTNFLPVIRLPERTLRLQSREDALQLPANWIARYDGPTAAWVLELPATLDESQVTCTEIAWSAEHPSGLRARNAGIVLFRQYLRRRCLDLGLLENPDAELFFPPGLLDRDRLSFQSYTGRPSYIQSVGYKTFRSSRGADRNRHHLVVQLNPRLDHFGEPVVELRLRVYLTDSQGNALSPRVVNRRRKRICQYWFNHQWWSRAVAVATWFSQGYPEVDLGLNGDGQIVVSGQLLTLGSPVGVAEPSADSRVEEPDEIREGPEGPEDDGEI